MDSWQEELLAEWAEKQHVTNGYIIVMKKDNIPEPKSILKVPEEVKEVKEEIRYCWYWLSITHHYRKILIMKIIS